MSRRNNQRLGDRYNVKLPLFGIPKILPYLGNHRKGFILMCVFTIISGLLDSLTTLFQRYSLNHFVGEGTLDTLWLYIIIYISFIVVMCISSYICNSHAVINEVSINKDLRNKLFAHLQTLSFGFYNTNSVGYILARVMSDSSHIGEILCWGANEGLWHITYLVFSIVIMFIIDIKLTLIVITVIPAITVLYALFQKKLLRINREIRELNSRITGDYNEGITGAKDIKTLVIEDKMESHFKDDTEYMRKISVKGSYVRGAFAATMHMASSVGIALVLWKGGYIAANEIGTFSLFVSYAEGIMEPVRWIVDEISDLIGTQVNIERVTKILETKPDVVDTPEVIEKYGGTFNPKKENWEELEGDIELRDVSFMYPDGDEYVLEHFNLHIPFGTNIAIVGETGAGKSTLANLICRFYEPTMGQVLIDGRDARERSQLWLHSNLGYVLQTPHLFSGTIRENLLYGKSDATEEEINEALRLVSASELVAGLEKGLDTDVGEGGAMLSTGEKQLISFARALIANPKILVLDEATASVDTITEQKIQSAIDTVIHGRTSIVIAHRLSTIRDADIILVVKDGKIIESGKHAELMKAGGYYSELYRKQFEDESTEKILSRK